jgi:hypothetical protein
MEGGGQIRNRTMIPFKFMLCAAVASLTFGLAWPDPELAGGRAPFPQDYMVLTADETTQQSEVQSEDNAEESAKMGKDRR